MGRSAKLVLVLILSWLPRLAFRLRQEARTRENGPLITRTLRMLNEVPGIVVAVIVVLVVVKPF